ncbi:MAG: radical SAM family heme chaperone HemW [Gaiellaceae bacterium]
MKPNSSLSAAAADMRGCGSQRLSDDRRWEGGARGEPAVPPVIRHLYVHVPFCSRRCDYCDFVSLAGQRDRHDRYARALLAELELERDLLASELETVYLGGGTPTFLEPEALRTLLEGLPGASELTVEANPETVTPALAGALVEAGVNRVSLGAQSFQPRLLELLGRRAGPADVRRAVETLRDAGVDNISLDLLYGIPGQRRADLDADLDEALALAPEQLSCYELEAKPGTRFARAHGAELAEQADALEDHLERIVERLTTSGYRWYETANFARIESGRDLRAAHNLGYWRGHDYLGIGMGAVSTVRGLRWRNVPLLSRYLAAPGRKEKPPRETEALDEATRLRERLMLGLRLDEPVALAEVEAVLDREALVRFSLLGLVENDGKLLTLTSRGRMLGGAISADLILWPDTSLAA